MNLKKKTESDDFLFQSRFKVSLILKIRVRSRHESSRD